MPSGCRGATGPEPFPGVKLRGHPYALDAENNIASWYPSTYIPANSQNGMIAWHDLVPAILAEYDGKLAFGTNKAQANKVEWTNLLAGPSLETQATYLDKAIAEKYIPFAPTMSEYIKPDEAVARYNNLKTFYGAHKHLFIGTGPYFVDQVFPVEGSVVMSHYDNYLFPAGQFSGYDQPRIAVVSVDGPTSVTIGQEATFNVTVNFNDQPYPAKDIDKVSYLVFDANNNNVGSGEATAAADGQYTVTLSKDITSKLAEGGSKLTVVVSSKVVSIPSSATAEFVVTK